MSVFNRRNAFIGWLVLTLAKPIAKQKARSAARKAGTKKGGAVAAAHAGGGPAAAGRQLWRHPPAHRTPTES